MAKVVVAEQARRDLRDLIATRSLPGDTRDRVRKSLARLEAFPQVGRRLQGRWRSFRAVIGPWPWMIFVYLHDERSDTATVVAIHDSRTASAATSAG